MSNENSEDFPVKRIGDGALEYIMELMDGKRSTSEQRFDELSDHKTAVSLFKNATLQFEKSIGITVLVPTKGDKIPPLNSGNIFKYDNQYGSYAKATQNGENVTFALAMKNDVIGFGFGENPENGSVEILTIDVEKSFRRSTGCKANLQIEGQNFEVGVGHVLVLRLINSINSNNIWTDAVNSHSRYIFKSLGLVEASEENGCVLSLQR